MSDDLADRINAQLDDCTPGPWQKDKGFWNSDHETTDVHIMVGRKFDDADGEIAEVVTRWDGSTPAQRMQARANARLIAAAPSLLAEARDEITRLREGITRHRDRHRDSPAIRVLDRELWALLDAPATASPVRDGTNTEQEQQ